MSPPQTPADFIRVHLIDPEMCTRCNTCEETCPASAISHDGRNYVVDSAICNSCLACISECPTGSIDNWRVVPREAAYSLDEQLSWDVLPAQQDLPSDLIQAVEIGVPSEARNDGLMVCAVAPESAARPVVNLHSNKSPALATIRVNRRLTGTDSGTDVHHIVLHFGATPFPVLEGQNLGILPPGADAQGRPHFMRAYSIASSRDGETPGESTVALTVKRVTSDHDGHPVRGVASNFLCDLQVGETVQVVGPMGQTFLMPDAPDASIVMICTGTGIAPMRGIIERRRRIGSKPGSLALYYGGRRPQEMPYHDELVTLPEEFLSLHLAHSRTPDQPKQYVQDLILAQAESFARLLNDDETYFYLCGLKAMESGIEKAISEICVDRGMEWDAVKEGLLRNGRLHLELY